MGRWATGPTAATALSDHGGISSSGSWCTELEARRIQILLFDQPKTDAGFASNPFSTYFVCKPHMAKTILQPGLALSFVNQVRLSAMPQHADAKHSEASCMSENSHLSPLLHSLSRADAKRVLRPSPYKCLLLLPKLQLHAKCHCYFFSAEIGAGSAHAIQHRRLCLLASHLQAPALSCWHWWELRALRLSLYC